MIPSIIRDFYSFANYSLPIIFNTMIDFYTSLLLTFKFYAQPQLIVNDTHIANDETTNSEPTVDRTDDEKNESNNPPEIVVEDEKLPIDINNTESIPIPNGTQDISLILSRTSGVVRQNMGAIGDFSAVRIRGSSFRQVEIFVDGIALNPEVPLLSTWQTFLQMHFSLGWLQSISTQ